MDVFSELKNAQVEQLGSDPVTHIKGRIYGTGVTSPVKIDDGTTFHKVLTDQMYSSIKTGLYPTGVTPSDLDSSFALANTKITSNYAISSASSAFTATSSTTYADVDNQSCTITCAGSRPVEIAVVSGDISVSSAGSDSTGYFRILRGATDISGDIRISRAGTSFIIVPGSSIRVIDTGASAASTTYKLQFKAASGTTVSVTNLKLLAREF